MKIKYIPQNLTAEYIRLSEFMCWQRCRDFRDCCQVSSEVTKKNMTYNPLDGTRFVGCAHKIDCRKFEKYRLLIQKD